MCRGGCARPVHGAPKQGPGTSAPCPAPDAGVLMVLPAEEYSAQRILFSALTDFLIRRNVSDT